MNISKLIDKSFPVLALVCALGLVATIAGCNGGVTDGRTHSTLSGTLSSQPALFVSVETHEDAAVEARKGDGSDDVISSATTDADGKFSLSVPVTQKIYLHAEDKPDYVSINTVISRYPSNSENMRLVIPGELMMRGLIDDAFDPSLQISDYAWLMIDVIDSNEDAVADVEFAVGSGLTVLYWDCDQNKYSATGKTGTCLPSGGRPMIFAHNNGDDNAIVTEYLTQNGRVIDALEMPLRKGGV